MCFLASLTTPLAAVASGESPLTDWTELPPGKAVNCYELTILTESSLTVLSGQRPQYSLMHGRYMQSVTELVSGKLQLSDSRYLTLSLT